MLDIVLASGLLAFATYRVWRLLAVDVILEPVRSKVIHRDGRLWDWATDLILCAWCLGFWLSGVAVVAYIAASGVGWGWLVLMWPAVSAAVGIIETVVDRLSDNG